MECFLLCYINRVRECKFPVGGIHTLIAARASSLHWPSEPRKPLLRSEMIVFQMAGHLLVRAVRDGSAERMVSMLELLNSLKDIALVIEDTTSAVAAQNEKRILRMFERVRENVTRCILKDNR